MILLLHQHFLVRLFYQDELAALIVEISFKGVGEVFMFQIYANGGIIYVYYSQ